MEIKKIDFSRMYMLGESNQKTFELTRSDEINSEEDFLRIHNIFKGKITPVKPVEIKMYRDGKKCDFHRHIDEVVISRSLFNILVQNKITGWSTFPVMLLDTKNIQTDGYFGLSVMGKCGPRDKTKYEKKQRLNYAGADFMEVYIGYYFSPETWDGSDMFSPEGTTVIIVTERVKQVLEAANITNVSFTRLTEVESTLSDIMY